MILRTGTRLIALVLSLLWVMASCAPASETEIIGDAEAGDEQIKIQVEAVIARAADVPQQIVVEVREGVVFISGSLDCESCGGLRTPGTIGTVQQSLGAVVRAVNGVNRVVFDLDSES